MDNAIRITIVSAEHIQPLLAIISCKPLPCHVLQPHEKHSLQIADETRLEVLFPFATDWMKRGTTLQNSSLTRTTDQSVSNYPIALRSWTRETVYSF